MDRTDKTRSILVKAARKTTTAAPKPKPNLDFEPETVARPSRAHSTRGKIKHRSLLKYTGSYDPDDFVVPASDGKGHSDRVVVRMSITHLREISNVVSSRAFPFKNDSDFVRWAVREGLLIINDLEEIPNSVMGQAEAAIVIARDLLFHKKFTETFDVLEEAVGMCHQRGALNEIKKLYQRVKTKLAGMPDGYWRDQYLSELYRRFGRYVDPKGTQAAREEKVG